MTVYVWGLSSKFAVYEPASGSSPDACSKHEAKLPLSEWMPPSLIEVFEIRGVPAPAGDFPATTGFQHLVSPRAAEVLGEILNECGLLYPVDLQGLAGGGWHIFQRPVWWTV